MLSAFLRPLNSGLRQFRPLTLAQSSYPIICSIARGYAALPSWPNIPSPPQSRTMEPYQVDSGWAPIVDHTVKILKTPASLEEQWAQKNKEAIEMLANRPPHNAYTGRSIKVAGGRVNEALRKLSEVVRFNHIRQEVRAQERHAKRGVKRRKLKSARWRRLFASEVRKRVDIVAKIGRRARG